MAEIVKTIENVDELFAQIEVNGQTFVSERYVPHTEYVPRRENSTDLHSTTPVPQQTPSAPVQGEDVYAVELNNVLHDFDDRELAVELDAEITARQNADTALQENITAEATARQNADTALGNDIGAEATARQNADTALGNDIGAEATARQNADTALSGDITTNTNAISAINAKIPNQASAQNQLADKNFVNSSIATNTADYISNNGQPFTSVAELEAYSGTVTNNDYAFVTGVDASGNTYYDRYKATVTGGTVTWALEYRLNNSSFTAEQWATINSGLTQSSVDSDIEDAIKALDVASVGGNGKYIKSISQVDGKIVAVEDNLTATGGLAFTGTRAQYEQAKLIPVGQVGYIPSGALVNITDENRTYETSGTGSGQTLSLIARVMKAGDGITITSDDAIKADTVTFTGTRAEWEALTTAQKAKYNIVNFTDEELTDDVITNTVEAGNMKAVTSNAVAEAIGKVISQNLDFVITTGNDYNYSGYYTVPKGTYIALAHFDHGSYNLQLLYNIVGNALLAPARSGVTNNGFNGGFTTVTAVLQSDGTKQIRGYVYPYGTVSSSTCLFNLTLIKVAD